jgi:hypothetical protein
MSGARKWIYLEGGPFDGRRLTVKKDVLRLTLTTVAIGKELLRARGNDKSGNVSYEEAMYQSTERYMDDGTNYFEYLEGE